MIIHSQGFEKAQQVRPGLPSWRLCVGQAGSFPKGFERLALHGEVGGDIPIGRRDAGVAEVVPDDHDIHAGLEQRNRATMPHNVRRHASFSERRYLLRGGACVLVQEVGRTVACQWLPPCIAEEYSALRRSRIDALDRRGRLFPERAYPIPTSFAVEPDLAGAG